MRPLRRVTCVVCLSLVPAACQAPGLGDVSLSSAPPIVGNGKDLPLTIPPASATSDGYLTASDWKTLNNKVGPTDTRLSDSRPPTPGSSDYIQNGILAQMASFNITGSALIGGEVGIGTATPQASLHLQGNGTQGLTDEFIRIDNKGVAIWDFGVAGMNSPIPGIVPGSFFFGNHLPETLVLHPGGKVGIGTNNPNSVLQVMGYVQIDVQQNKIGGDCSQKEHAGRLVVVGGQLCFCPATYNGWTCLP